MAEYLAAAELVKQIRAFAFGGDAPAEIADRLQSLPGVDADVICAAGELLYAHYDLLDAAGVAIVARIYEHAIQQGWAGYNQGDRSADIVARVDQHLAGAGGETAAWPAPDTRLRDDYDWRQVGAGEQ